MKPITKLYLKTFLFMGIPYGLFMVIFNVADGYGFRLWKFLFSTFFFGITMSLILVSFHKYRLKKNGIQEITDENLGVNQSKSLQSKLSKKELIERLKADPIIGKMRMTEIENGVLINSGMTWKSWGEEIKIMLRSNRGDEFEYQVSSQPKLRTTLVDYGKNLENVIRIENALRNIA